MATCRKCWTTWTGHRAEHCTTCHQTFTSATAGDMHRTGKHDVYAGPNRRRCLTPDEMTERGMTQTTQGHWTSASDGRWTQ